MPTAAVYGCRNACSLNKHELVSPSVRSCSLEEDFFRKRPLLRLTAYR